MDLRKDITYGGSYSLNDASVDSTDTISGNTINDLNISPVSNVGYVEKKAISPGMDASDTYLGGRIVKIQGQTFGSDHADMYDKLSDLLSALSPDAALNQDPANLGYLPLAGQFPTKDTSFTADSDGVRWIPVLINCRAKNPPLFDLNRDKVGGIDYGLTVPWQVELDARDPRIYFATAQTKAFTGTSGSGTLQNRGLFSTPMSVTLNIIAAATASTFTLTIPGAVLTIAIPNNASTQSWLYDGQKRVLYQKIGSGLYTKNIGAMTLTSPLMAAPPDSGAYSWSITNAILAAGSQLSYNEAWG